MLCRYAERIWLGVLPFYVHNKGNTKCIAVLPGCTIEAAEKLSRPFPLPAEEPFGWLLSLFLFFDEGTATLSQRPEGLVARNSGEQFVHIPGPFRFGRRLKQHQIHVAHHAAVLADMSVLGEKVGRH